LLIRTVIAAPATAVSVALGTMGFLPPSLGEVPGGERSELEGDGGGTPCRDRSRSTSSRF